jgi:hypothetical protein
MVQNKKETKPEIGYSEESKQYRVQTTESKKLKRKKKKRNV